MQRTGLIVGLGNPGKEYENTRHNFGFMAVDAAIDRLFQPSAVSLLSGKKDKFILQRCSIPGRGSWFFAKPLTFMNNSGQAVQHIADYYRIETENILVVHDELDIELGHLKFKLGGGNAGHRGLQSIQQMLGTGDFYRLRLGIGKKAEAYNWVLGRFAKEENGIVSDVLKQSVEIINCFIENPGKDVLQKYRSVKVSSTVTPGE